MNTEKSYTTNIKTTLLYPNNSSQLFAMTKIVAVTGEQT